MNKEFILPDIGEGIVECEVIEWKVREGDIIEEDQIVVDVSTDKAIVEIPSMYNGRITKLHHAAGDIAKVHAPLFAIEVEAEAEADEDAGSPAPVTQSSEQTPELVVLEEAQAQGQTQQSAETNTKVLTTPAVRKMAREHQLDLGTIAGTGKQGRVLKEDVLSFLASDKPADAPSSPLASIPNSTPGVVAEDRVEVIRGVRKIMAERMTESVATIPHFTFVDELDVTELMQLRRNLNEQYGSDELKITLMPLFIKALSLAIKQFPAVNSRANADFSELTYIASHNIGMAVDGANGLLVPNIKAVEQRSILDIAAQVMGLPKRLAAARLTLQI